MYDRMKNVLYQVSQWELQSAVGEAAHTPPAYILTTSMKRNFSLFARSADVSGLKVNCEMQA